MASGDSGDSPSNAAIAAMEGGMANKTNKISNTGTCTSTEWWKREATMGFLTIFYKYIIKSHKRRFISVQLGNGEGVLGDVNI